MPNHRFYEPQDLIKGKTITLSSKTSHHIATVLRLKVEKPITLFDGKGTQASAVITSLARQKVGVKLLSAECVSCESPLKIHLAQAISKGERMELVVQKAVELGVASFTPLITQHLSLKLNKEKLDKKHEKWTDIVVSASEQCGRNHLMTIHPVTHFDTWLSTPIAKKSLFLDPESQARLDTLSLPTDEIGIMIGPEGGFSLDEKTKALDAGIKGIQMGPRILRTETAAISACTLLQAYFGDI